MTAIDKLQEFLDEKGIDYGNLLCKVQAEFDDLSDKNKKLKYDKKIAEAIAAGGYDDGPMGGFSRD